MKFYYAKDACSLAPHILLKETGLSVTLLRVDISTHRTEAGDDFYEVNPKGSVPVLEIDPRERLTEGPIVAQYICDLAGRTDLMPAAGTMHRYRVMEWQNFITSDLHKRYSMLFNPAISDSAKTVIRQGLRSKYEWLTAALAQTAHLAGQQFTAADAYLFTVTRWASVVGLDLADLPPLQDFMKRVAGRSAVQQALVTERSSCGDAP